MTLTADHELASSRTTPDDGLDLLDDVELLAAVTPQNRTAVSARLLERASRETDPHERKRLQDEVVVLHIGLARAIAARYRGRGIADEDLSQAASIALLKAARNFDPAIGVEFLSYAVVTMKGEVKRQFRDFGWMVRPPRPIQKLQADVSRAQGELTHLLGHSPKVKEVAVHLGVPEEDVVEALRSSAFARSETFLQLAWVVGAAFGVLLPSNHGGAIGFWVAGVIVSAVAAVVVLRYRVINLIAPTRERKGYPGGGAQREPGAPEKA